jgi:hypothetical protein
VRTGLRRVLMEPEFITIRQDSREITARVVVEGKATGILMGGNLSMIGRSVGWMCPPFVGSILFSEPIDTFIGPTATPVHPLRHPDLFSCVKTREVVGQRCARGLTSRTECAGTGWVADWARSAPSHVPLGTMAMLNTTASTLTIEPGVR